jgi:hypothetical protein
LFDENSENATEDPAISEYPVENEVKAAVFGTKTIENQSVITVNKPSVKVKKIAVFYSDNTYDEFIPVNGLSK